MSESNTPPEHREQQSTTEWKANQIEGSLIKTPSGWEVISQIVTDNNDISIHTETVESPNTPQPSPETTTVDTTDRDSEFAPEFPHDYSKDAESLLRKLKNNSDEKALLIATIGAGTYITYEDGSFVRWLHERKKKGLFNKKTVKEGFKIHDKDSEDIVKSVHGRLNSGTKMKLVPKDRLEKYD